MNEIIYSHTRRDNRYPDSPESKIAPDATYAKPEFEYSNIEGIRVVAPIWLTGTDVSQKYVQITNARPTGASVADIDIRIPNHSQRLQRRPRNLAGERERGGSIARFVDAICEYSPASLRYWNSSEKKMPARTRMRHQVQWSSNKKHNGRMLGRWHSFVRHNRHRRTKNRQTDRQTDRRRTDRQTDRRTDW